MHPQTYDVIIHPGTFSFLQCDSMANRLAHYLHASGFRKGDSIAICLENRLEYTAMWMGCAKIGVVPALININIRGKVLAHKLEVAKAKAIIFSSEMEASKLI